MSEYYNSRRTRNLFDPGSKEPFKLSRSKIDLFTECPRCFYLDARLGVGRPRGPAFTLNVAVDHLMKKEFDIHRAAESVHPLLESYGVKCIPFSHKDLEEWRENFKGIRYLHEPTNLLITGAIDDVWKDTKGEIVIVDYKATSKEGRLEKLEDSKWNNQYRRQMEIYQWLFRQNGFKVSDTGYFVYVNGKKDKEAFDGKLEFDVTLIPHKGSDEWIEKTLSEVKKCLVDERIPKGASECDFCSYVDSLGEVLRQNIKEMESKKVSKQKKDKTESSSTLF